MMQSVRRVDELAVEVEARCAADPARATSFQVLQRTRLVDMRLEIAIEPKDIQMQTLCEADQKFRIELACPTEEEIVELPELALGSGRFSSLGGHFRMRVGLPGRKVSID